MGKSFEETVQEIVAKDRRYDPLAYALVRNALAFTQKEIASFDDGRLRHLTGQELLEGIREYSTAIFGSQTHATLSDWGVNSCNDFGEIVFNMVEFGLLAKTENDSRADFENGYDFAEAFPKPFYQNRVFIVFCITFIGLLIIAFILKSKL